MKKLLLILLIVLPTVIQAQLTPEEEARIEKLKLIIDSDQHDTIRINALKEWDNMVYFFDFATDSSILEQIKEICEENLEKELSSVEKRYFMLERAKVYDYLGTIYANSSDVEGGIESHKKAIEFYKQLGEIVGMDGAYINLGTALYEQGKVQEAIDAFRTGIRICEMTSNIAYKSNGLMNLGLIYLDLGDVDMALKYYDDALVLAEEAQNVASLEGIYLNMGNIYIQTENKDSAMICYRKALEYGVMIRDEFMMGTAYHNIGMLFMSQTEMDSAYHYLILGKELREKVFNEAELIYSYSGLSKYHSKLGNHTKSIQLAEQCYSLVEHVNRLADYITATETMYLAYERAGQPGQAYEYYKLWVHYNDSLKSVENHEAMIRQDVDNEYRTNKLKDDLEVKKQREIDQAKFDKDIEHETQLRNVAYFGAGIFLLVGIWAIYQYRRKKADNLIISQQKDEVEQQKTVIEEAHKEITDSIAYAKRIQSAILPPMKVIKENLPNSFVMYLPKDVVAGDFYWMEKVQDELMFAAADCTGHGVPGAMVSVVCNNGLNRSVREHGLTEPAQILDKTREIVIQEFEKSEEEVKDGMDIALVSFNGSNNKLKFAGAHNPLWVIRKGAEEIEEYKGDKQPIGKFEASKPFTAHQVELNPGDSFYIFSDGYADQFGGDKGKKFKAANLKRLLLSFQGLSMEEQQAKLLTNFNDWKGSLEQLDDVCIIGVRV